MFWHFLSGHLFLSNKYKKRSSLSDGQNRKYSSLLSMIYRIKSIMNTFGYGSQMVFKFNFICMEKYSVIEEFNTISIQIFFYSSNARSSRLLLNKRYV